MGEKSETSRYHSEGRPRPVGIVVGWRDAIRSQPNDGKGTRPRGYCARRNSLPRSSWVWAGRSTPASYSTIEIGVVCRKGTASDDSKGRDNSHVE